MKLFSTIYFKIGVMLICIAVTAFTLSRYAILIRHLLKIKYNWQFELVIVVGMLLFQYPFIYNKSTVVKLTYYYNMLLVSLMANGTTINMAIWAAWRAKMPKFKRSS